MAKKYTYTDTKSNRVIFESVEPNYVSPEDVDKKVVAKTGEDPRLNPHIQRTIRVVNETDTKSVGRYDRSKRLANPQKRS